ncbi:MAG: hypothetical protein DRJ42_01115 [Deltaproteobacteria bacterium]|nr:MAG: hypothetical protein DRJ42_01115 [Deltaproteobacteria bacterium]
MIKLGVEDIEGGYRGGRFGEATRTPAPVARNVDVHVSATWPVSATASSQYGLSSWQAPQACGRPKVWPRSGDVPGAWAPRKKTSPVEWLEVRFDPGPPTEVIRVFETCGPGAVYAVTVDSGGGFEVVWLGPPNTKLGSTAQLLDVRLPKPQPVHEVRVYIDNTFSKWSEIDSIARLSSGAPVALDTKRTHPSTEREPAGARRYTPRQIEGIDSLVDSRGVWPISARASSEYNAGSWSAAQMVGRPKVWPRGGDRRGAWAPKMRRSADEWVEATFPRETPPTRAIRIFETCAPGSTVEVRIGTEAGLERVWQGAREEHGSREARVLEVDLPSLRRVDRVWCRIDNTGPRWSEIDSIALLTPPRRTMHDGVPRGSAYRSGADRTLRERLMRGFDGKPLGRGSRYTFFEMMSHDWRARWRGTWPASARASSSYGGYWGAGHATGSPGLYPVSGDLPGAWAPREREKGVDWLELAFDALEPVRTIRVFETYGAGATFAVTVIHGRGESLVWQDAPAPVSGAQVLEIELPRPQRIEGVCVYVDNAIPGWPQIDTVGLLEG